MDRMLFDSTDGSAPLILLIHERMAEIQKREKEKQASRFNEKVSLRNVLLAQYTNQSVLIFNFRFLSLLLPRRS